ncbi:MAG: hypothetical protein V4678_01120 [Patescibacteria group bacterium]
MSLSHERPVPANPNATPAEQDAARQHVEATVDGGKGRKGMVAGLAAAVAATVIGGGFYLTKGENDSSPNPERNPAATSSPNPGQTEATAEATSDPTTETTPEVTATPETTSVGPTELTVERYNDGESLMYAIFEQENEWLMTGATPETKANEDPLITRDQYIAELNKPVDDAYVSVLYVSDWQQRPDLAREVNDNIRNHYAVVLTNMGTTDTGNSLDVEPYEHSTTLTSAVELSNNGSEIVVEYEYTRQDNSDQNRAHEFITETYSTPITGHGRATWVQEDGVWKVSEVVPVN